MTLIPLKLHSTHGSDVLAGYMGSIYYFGLLAGSFRSEKLVARIGHIRSFSAFMALLCSSVLSLAVFDSTSAWLFLRFINGLAVAGVFVVVESWLLCESDDKNRGKLLALYMVALYGANALGQLFVGWIDSESLMPFLLIGILLSLSILPPAVTRLPAPALEFSTSLSFLKLIQLTPTGFVGCMAGGLVLGALYSLLPIYLLEEGNPNLSVGLCLGVTMIGGMLLQYPVGYCSDYIDRRKVLVAVSLTGCFCCFLFIGLPLTPVLQLTLLFLIGGTTFTLYPLAISHGCDHMEPEDIVSGTQGLLLGYSSGACIGPIIGSYFMHGLADGLMVYFSLVMGLLALFFAVRIPFRPKIYSSNEQSFIPVTRTSPVIAQIDPRSDNDESN